MSSETDQNADSLFRQQVVHALHDRQLGHAWCIQPIGLRHGYALLVAMFIIATIFVATNGYHRRETARGYLVPVSGVVKIRPSRAGTLEQILVDNGDSVKRGDRIAVIGTTGTETESGQTIPALIASLEK